MATDPEGEKQGREAARVLHVLAGLALMAYQVWLLSKVPWGHVSAGYVVGAAFFGAPGLIGLWLFFGKTKPNA